MSKKRVATMFINCGNSRYNCIDIYDNFTINGIEFNLTEQINDLLIYLNQHNNQFILLFNGDNRYIVNTSQITHIIEPN